MRPRNGTDSSSASNSPPPLPKMSLSCAQLGHTKWLMFSIKPSVGTLSFWYIRTARRVVAGEERHRDDLHPVLFRRNDLLAVGGELGLDAEHDRHVRAVDVAVDH